MDSLKKRNYSVRIIDSTQEVPDISAKIRMWKNNIVYQKKSNVICVRDLNGEGT
jgi:hypothetical protein